jgi:hypothetical protein
VQFAPRGVRGWYSVKSKFQIMNWVSLLDFGNGHIHFLLRTLQKMLIVGNNESHVQNVLFPLIIFVRFSNVDLFFDHLDAVSVPV